MKDEIQEIVEHYENKYNVRIDLLWNGAETDEVENQLESYISAIETRNDISGDVVYLNTIDHRFESFIRVQGSGWQQGSIYKNGVTYRIADYKNQLNNLGQ